MSWKMNCLDQGGVPQTAMLVLALLLLEEYLFIHVSNSVGTDLVCLRTQALGMGIDFFFGVHHRPKITGNRL